MILINPDFSKGIIAKYSVLVQRHRSFPVLTFLFIKPPPISFLQYLLLKTMTITRSHRNYYLNQNFHFNYNYNLNPNLFSRIVEMSYIIIENRLEKTKTVTGAAIKKEPGRVKWEIPAAVVNTSLIEKEIPGNQAEPFPGVEVGSPLLNLWTSQNREPRKTVYYASEVERNSEPVAMDKEAPILSAAEKHSYTRITPLSKSARDTREPVLPAAEKTSYTKVLVGPQSSPADQREISISKTFHTGDKLEKTEKSHFHHTIALFKPLTTAVTPQLISRNFKDCLLFVHPGKLIPGNTKEKGFISITHQDINVFTSHLTKGAESPDSSHFSSLLNYSSPFKAAMDDIKKTVTSIEKKVKEKEEKILTKRSYTTDFTSSVSGNPDNINNSTNIPQSINIDMNHLTNQVYRMLERKIMIEKERRGL